MKKIFLHRLLIIGTALTLNTQVPAQTSHTTPFTVADAGTHSSLMTTLKAKHEKAYNHLIRTFPEAIVSGVHDEKDGTHIKASVNGNTLRVQYDTKGRFSNSVLSYPCSELKEAIADQVMQAYPGFSIFSEVLEVKAGTNSALFVMIENRKTWRRVRLTSEGIDVYEEYVKSN